LFIAHFSLAILVPSDIESFRLGAKVPIFVDYKSNPYKDTDGIICPFLIPYTLFEHKIDRNISPSYSYSILMLCHQAETANGTG